MKNETIKILRFFSLALLAIFLGFASFYIFLFARCFFAEKHVPNLGEQAIMRVEIYGTSLDTVSARFALLDTSGREFAVLDRSWSGNVLSVEFTSAAFGNREFLFPLNICAEQYLPLGKSRTYRGTPLPRYYLYDDVCAFLDDSWGFAERHALFSLATFAVWQSSKFRSSRSKVISLDLSAIVSRETYEIYLNPTTGSLRLSRT